MYPSLAIDCTDQISSVAISDGDQLWQVENQIEKRQARKILSLVDECLAQAGFKKTQLKSICWAAGPGSFTGLRIATAVSQGLAYALNLPMLRVSSLEALAVSISRDRAELQTKLITITDAYMGEYYWAIFEVMGPDNLPKRLSEDSLGELSDIPDSRGTGITLAVGNCADKIYPEADLIRFKESSLRARDLFAIAKDQFRNGLQISASEAEPIYLRSKSAWKTLDEQAMTTKQEHKSKEQA